MNPLIRAAKSKSKAGVSGPWTKPLDEAGVSGPWTKPLDEAGVSGPWTKPLDKAGVSGPWTQPSLAAAGQAEPPAPPDYLANAPGSAWYYHRLDAAGQASICRYGSGWELLDDVQGVVRERLGNVVGITQLDARGGGTGWNGPLLATLADLARRDRAPAAYVAVLERAAAAPDGTPLDAGVLATALWMANYSRGLVRGTNTERWGAGSPDEVVIPPGARLPRKGERPANIANIDLARSGALCTPAPSVRLPPVAQPAGGGLWRLASNPWVAGAFALAAFAAVAHATRQTPTFKQLRGMR